MQKPNTLGLTRLEDIPLREIVPFIRWSFFFQAWKMTGKYDGIETVCDCSSCKTAWLQQFSENEREKAEEALKLFRDAQEMLRRFLDEKLIRVHAVFGIFPARSDGNDIMIRNGEKETTIPFLRQQHAADDGFCYSLADFLDTNADFIGVFACTVAGADDVAKQFEQENDIFHSILVKTLADRLAEAASEWLHFCVRKKYWGYNPDEKLDIKAIFKNQYPGIRPAVGYPALPDQSLIFDLNNLITFDEIGITLTENGAMSPNSSVCGLYFAHPKARYFMIGKIDENQLSDYAHRRGKTTEQMKKWLTANI